MTFHTSISCYNVNMSSVEQPITELPEGKAYREVTTLQGDDLLSPLAAPDFLFAVREAFD